MTLRRTIIIANHRIIVETRNPKMKRRKHPTDPAQIARLRLQTREREAEKRHQDRNDPGSWGPSDATLTQDDIGDTPPTRHKVRRIQRFDCFALMLERADTEQDRERLQPTVVYIRRYQDDVAKLHRSAGTSPDGVVVDFSRSEREFADIAAGERLRAVEAHMGGQSARLMRTIAESAVGTSGRAWRSIVEGVTGERNPNAQGALIRAAMHNTQAAYQIIDGPLAGKARAAL